jgi:hypothetical protein
MGMKAIRQAISYDMPHCFKNKGGSVLDPTLGEPQSPTTLERTRTRLHIRR